MIPPPLWFRHWRNRSLEALQKTTAPSSDRPTAYTEVGG